MKKSSFFCFLCLLLLTSVGRAQNARFSVRAPLADSVNSPQDESALIMSSDGQRMYFVRSFYPGNVGGIKGKQDIYVSNKIGPGVWSKARNMGRPLNDEFHNAVCGISTDGRRLFLNSIKVRQNKTVPAIALSKYEGGSWSVPVSLSTFSFPPKGFFQAFVSFDETVAIVSFEGKKTRGLEDLYVMKRGEDGKYGDPVHMGNVLNTAGFETSPVLAKDGKTLYFSSNGRGGVGDADIFKSTRLDDTWTNWSVPEPMGARINTSGFDGSFFVDDQGIAYYISGEGASDPGDIYSIDLTLPPPPDPAVEAARLKAEAEQQAREQAQKAAAERAAAERAARPDAVAAKPAGVQEPAADNTQTASPSPGRAAAVSPSGPDKDKPAPESSAPAGEEVSPSRVDNLGPALFAYNSVVLDRGSQQSLLVVVGRLKGNRKYKVQVEGHTDDEGTEAKNQLLSERRAASVKKFLVRNGIPAANIKAQGFGERNPVGDNSTPEGRLKNRRVEVRYFLEP
jgi:OOP family OmpA-OmpF porin